ncbi:Gfo/Idh/MocA family oxidoreductase [Pedobacter sp. KR3-3]|uniref:Gfo/Idh/MocA family oxidoreductase n=1 Tax=Pedobacter albus TaxID=3113905 RepID=A0ABU7I6W9_9SPHI|nr:Gfo/Idh/MocA family oxidoreductase [Pedobacter sp. KR3-3]MEE1945212.1 Gfo/Idh/MocA family oxidoreductase [Pedobacter sp. KR3-3]
MKRRTFIHAGSLFLASTGLANLLPLNSFSMGQNKSDKIRIGVIGINGMGWSNLTALLKDPRAQCVTLCDVDQNVLDKRVAELAKSNITVSTTNDYQKILENKDIDAVVIGTPDHWHCKITVDALAAGKDVYVEKPAGNSIAECNEMVAAQQRYNKVVQVGQWQRSQKHFADAIAYVHSGKLGNVRLVKAWAYQGWMKAIPVASDTAVPTGVDYNKWLGPATMRPFNPNRFHFNFRWFWDYAGGLMTDWGVHMIDYALLGMKATTPKSIVASGGKFAYPDDASETPDTLTAIYEFNGFNLQWEHATGIDDGPYGRTHGVAFIGNNGTLVLNRQGWEVIPEKDGGKDKIEAVPLQKSVDNGLQLHTRNFLDVIQSRKMEDLKAPIQAGAHVANICQMGNIAYRTGKKIYWDASKGRFTDGTANKYLAAQYHNGYKMPKV